MKKLGKGVEKSVFGIDILEEVLVSKQLDFTQKRKTQSKLLIYGFLRLFPGEFY